MLLDKLHLRHAITMYEVKGSTNLVQFHVHIVQQATDALIRDSRFEIRENYQCAIPASEWVVESKEQSIGNRWSGSSERSAVLPLPSTTNTVMTLTKRGISVTSSSGAPLPHTSLSKA